MPHFKNPFTRDNKGLTSQPAHRKTSSLNSVGRTVQPGKVLTKMEREQRKSERADSAFSTLDGQHEKAFDYNAEHNWAGFKAKMAANLDMSPFLQQLDLISRDFAAGADLPSLRQLHMAKRSWNLRSLIVFVIFFLLVFGALFTLLEYLLLQTRASACSVSTVYLPVTYTVTPYVPSASPQAQSNYSMPDITSTSIITQTSIITETHTLTTYFSDQVETAPLSSSPASGGHVYAYTVDSAGSTHWIDGMSPSAGALLATITTTVVMQPVAPTDPAATPQSVITQTNTVTPPPYASTLYSYVPSVITSTSTSTHYITYTVSAVDQAPNSITTTRTLLPGPSSDGWNATSPTEAGIGAQVAPTSAPVLTTITGTSLFGSGAKTTSTKTFFITTTVAAEYTTTITQVIQSSISGHLTVLTTGVPVTITPVSGKPLLSTNVTAPSPMTSPATPITSAAGNGTASNSSPAPSSVIGNTSPRLSSYSLYTPSTSQAMQNATSVAVQTEGPTQKSVTQTFSAAANTATQSSSSSPQLTSSLGTALSSSTGQITSTTSNLSPLALSSASSAVLLNSSVASLSPYGYPTSASNPESLSIANSFTTHSTVRPAASSASPSTLATSRRSSPTHNTKGPSASSSGPCTSSSGRTTNSPTSGTSSVPSTTKKALSSSTSAGDFTIQTSMPTDAPASAAPTASNPFPPSSPTATPTAGCGEHGNFMVDFDDLPSFLPTNSNNVTITQAPPVLSPYHHLTFSDGYVYAPEPDEPYQPSSQPHLAVFLANATGRTASPFGNLVRPGEIGDGPRDSMSTFWFDAQSAYFGCDNAGQDPCTLVFSAYTWNETSNAEVLSDTKNESIPACATLTQLNCQLNKVEFPKSFRNLTGLQVQAYTGDEQRMFFMDDLALSWSNNSCAAGLLRQSSR